MLILLSACGGKMIDSTTNNSSSDLDLTSKSSFSTDNNIFTSRSYAALLAKNKVPLSHKQIADNYMVIKKIFKFQVNHNKISNAEKELLRKYDFNLLEYTTMQQMYDELTLLQKWSLSDDEQLKKDSDTILQIRVSELKYLESNNYVAVSNEIYNGYQALAHYLKEISKFQSMEPYSVY